MRTVPGIAYGLGCLPFPRKGAVLARTFPLAKSLHLWLDQRTTASLSQWLWFGWVSPDNPLTCPKPSRKGGKKRRERRFVGINFGSLLCRQRHWVTRPREISVLERAHQPACGAKVCAVGEARIERAWVGKRGTICGTPLKNHPSPEVFKRVVRTAVLQKIRKRPDLFPIGLHNEGPDHPCRIANGFGGERDQPVFDVQDRLTCRAGLSLLNDLSKQVL